MMSVFHGAPALRADRETAQGGQPRAIRPLGWSLRRELWENRSIFVAPLAVSVVVLIGSAVAVAGLPGRIAALPAGDAAALHAVVSRPFGLAPAPIMLATFLVGLFYSLDALYGERRDRSILFWKSLPVSDLTTVLAKAIVPLAVLPAIGLALGLATLALLLLVGSLVFPANGLDPASLWREVRVLELPPIMLYGLAVHVLWFAPIHGWLLLVSAWARRMPVLWAALPPFALAAVEWMAFRTTRFGCLLGYRVTGAMEEAFEVKPTHDAPHIERLSQLDPLGFLSSPGLWAGLAFAAACLAVAVHLRRRRHPI